MKKNFLTTAALLGALSVALGAFAAHGLKKLLSPDQVQVFETGVRYQFYHVFALLAAGILYKDFPSNAMVWAGRMFIGGIVLFSGSLYLMSYCQYQGINARWAGPVTPIGGVLFIAGWILLFVAIVKKRQ